MSAISYYDLSDHPSAFYAENVVYFLYSKDGVKIGKANKLRRRISNYRTHNNGELTLIAFLFGSEKETLAHEKFKKHRIRGEWFDISPEKAMEYCDSRGGITSENVARKTREMLTNLGINL